MSMTMAHTRYRQQFDIAHKSMSLAIGEYLVYEDGAMMERSPYGFTIDPPTDPYKLALVQIQFYQEAVSRAATQFGDMKDALARHTDACQRNNLPAPPDSELENLKKAKRLVRKYQNLLEGARSRAEKYLPVDIKRRRQAEQAVQIDSEEFASKLGKIKI